MSCITDPNKPYDHDIEWTLLNKNRAFKEWLLNYGKVHNTHPFDEREMLLMFHAWNAGKINANN